MVSTKLTSNELGFPPEKIVRQVEKILLDPLFLSSEILSRFLKFIVDETLEGYSNCLKEYTIALNVLKKPKTFKPNENCIVRIHAGRLRKVLIDYYSGPGVLDEICISLPKGHYIPVFTNNFEHALKSMLSSLSNKQDQIGIAGEVVTTAVLPFHYQSRNQMVRSFSEGLGIQLSSALSKIKSLSVISYNISRRLPEKFVDVKDIGLLFNVQYVITGYVQWQRNTVRVTVDMVKSDTSQQVWSEMFERKITDANSFKVQDEIIGRVVKALYKQTKNMATINKSVPVMAVA